MLAFTILGLAGCAMAFVALALDWRERNRTFTVDFGDSTTWTTNVTNRTRS